MSSSLRIQAPTPDEFKIPFPETPFVHKFQCSSCNAAKTSSEIKMCGGCKLEGYCSKECQRKHWPIHKSTCKGLQSGKPAKSRDHVLKIVERLARDTEIMGWIDAIIITALELWSHPENGGKYTVVIWARTEVDERRTREARLAAGKKKTTVRLLQLIKTTLIDNATAPAALNKAAQDMENDLKNEPIKWITVRAMWRSEENLESTMFFSRPICPEMIDVVVKNRPPGNETLSAVSRSSPEGMIRGFNEQSKFYDDVRDKFTLITKDG